MKLILELHIFISKTRSKWCRADVPPAIFLLFYVPCQQVVVVYKLLISFQFFFANPSKPTYDAPFCQFMYVISKPKKPGTGTGNPAGKQIANFVPRGCGRADVRTCGRADTRYPGIRICPSLNGRGRPCVLIRDGISI